jgi:hypothetical protein
MPPASESKYATLSSSRLAPIVPAHGEILAIKGAAIVLSHAKHGTVLR